MKLFLKGVDEEIDRLCKEGGPSACFLKGMIESDVRGIDSPERVLESAMFYGDQKKLMRLIQLVFIRSLARRHVDGEEWSARALAHMDQIVQMQLKGLLASRDAILRMFESELEKVEQTKEIEEATRDVGA